MTSPRQKEWEFSERSERTERSERQIEYALRNEDGAYVVTSQTVCRRLPGWRHNYGAQPTAGKRCHPVSLE